MDDGTRTLEQVAARLAALEDEQAVRDTLTRLGDAFAGTDVDAWIDCFAEDGTFSAAQQPEGPSSYLLTGHAELRPWFVEHAGRLPRGTLSHALTQVRVALDGEAASATSLLLIIHRIDGVPTLRATVRWEDDLVRCGDGRWRVARRHGVDEMRLQR